MRIFCMLTFVVLILFAVIDDLCA